uniref:DUF4283 domain-containing protein n=1 Tax=Quercus lobata TaxID=97700 RepID=A0A7N2LS13_QUELO
MGVKKVTEIAEVGSNLFQFKFKIEFDLERVLRGGPWPFDNQVLMVRRWQAGMTAKDVKFNVVGLWVQIWGVPFDMVCPQVAREVGSRLGMVEEVEQRRRNDMQNLFMRVKVAIPISKPIRRGGFLLGLDRQRTWATFKYERLPIFCHYCGLLGHDLKHCASHFATTKNGGEVICQYGDWLKASGGRLWSPSKRESKRHGKAQIVQVMVDDNSQTEEQGGMTTGNTEHGANSNEHDRREEGKSKILRIYMGHEKRDKGNPEMIGMKSDSGDKRYESHGPTDMDMEVLDMAWEDDTYPSLNSKAQDNVAESNLKRKSEVSCPSAKHVEIQSRDGPRDSKNGPTWKRLANSQIIRPIEL